MITKFLFFYLLFLTNSHAKQHLKVNYLCLSSHNQPNCFQWPSKKSYNYLFLRSGKNVFACHLDHHNKIYFEKEIDNLINISKTMKVKDIINKRCDGFRLIHKDKIVDACADQNKIFTSMSKLFFKLVSICKR